MSACFYPITIPKYQYLEISKPGKKSLHNLKFSTKRIIGRIQVPCGRCPACRRRKQNEWAFRIMEEAKRSKKTAFVTLTYDDSNLVYSDLGIPTLCPDHFTNFLKRLRHDLETESLRYFLCGEYGDQFDRPHGHCIFFYNGDLDDIKLADLVQKHWKFGFTLYEPGISAGRAKYCAKYTMKSLTYDYKDVVPPFARMSRRPGIGRQFLDHVDYNEFRKRNQWFVHDYQGTPYALPRYYAERIFNSNEREQHSLLLNRLLGNKFDLEFINRDKKDNFYKFISDKAKYQEYLFMKSLNKENYGFKFKPYQPKPRPKTRYDDLKPNEDFSF